MDISSARALYDHEDFEYKKWENGCPLTIGLNILAKYRIGTYDFSFAHDQIYVADFKETVEQMTQEELIIMYENGWFESDDSWSLFS